MRRRSQGRPPLPQLANVQEMVDMPVRPRPDDYLVPNLPSTTHRPTTTITTHEPPAQVASPPSSPNLADQLNDPNHDAAIAEFVMPGFSTEGSTSSTTEEPTMERDAKRQKTDMAPEPSQDSSVSSSQGSGHNSASDGGFDSSQGPVSFFPTGGYGCSSGSQTFTKVHQMKSWAIPFWTVADTVHGNTAYMVTTPLAHIPWEYAFFYLSEEEFDLIPPGSYVRSVHMEVIQTVAQTSYGTGSISTDQALQNHAKVVYVGKDLEKKIRGGITRRVKLDATTPMIPSTLSDASTGHDNFIKYQYGTDQTASGLSSVILPGCAHQIPLYNYNHFCIYQPSFATANTQGFDANNAPGFEYFSHAVTAHNANDSTWDVIDRMSYKFECAPIGKRYDALEILPNNVNNRIGTAPVINLKKQTTGLAPSSSAPTTLAYTPGSYTNNAIPLVTYKSSTMEKGPHYSVGAKSYPPARQPTYHIGMKAIDKVDPNSSDERASKFVQANVEFIIKATMVVGLPQYPNRFTKPKAYTTSIENTAYGSGGYNADKMKERVVTYGLYNETSTAPTVDAVDLPDISNTRPRRDTPSTVARRTSYRIANNHPKSTDK